MKEKWKYIKDYELLYEVSNFGRVRSLDRFDSCGRKVKGKILQVNYNQYGYVSVILCKNGQNKRVLIHRLVLSTFVPIINMNKMQVNHINENKTDNRICNLEWCDAKYNINYGTRTKKATESKSIPVKCLTTGEEFKSISEASRFYNINKQSLSMHLRGKTKSCVKMIWEYKK